MNGNKYIRYGVIIAVLMVGLYFLLNASGITYYFSLDYIKQQRLILQAYVDSNYGFTSLSYIALYVLVAAFALPFASLFTLVGGFLFGVFYGTLYTIIGATLGAGTVFLMVRYFVGNYLHDRYKEKLDGFNTEFDKNGIYYLFMIRFISVVPFFLINISAGLTQAPLWQFILTTMIGITPATFVYTYAGRQLMYINSMQDIITVPVLLAFVGLACLSLIPVFIKKLFFH